MRSVKDHYLYVMKLIRIAAFLFFVSVFTGIKAQHLSYNGSKYDQTGEPGLMVTPQLEITNTGSVTVGVIVNRFYQGLPANWTSCFCYIECNPPSLSTLSFSLAPGETAHIGVGFATDSIPGLGTVRLTVEEVGSSLAKDTLQFTGSTMISGISEISQKYLFSVYPNPTSDKVILQYSKQEPYLLLLLNASGQIIMRSEQVSHECSVDLQHLPCGTYYLKTHSVSGETLRKIIRN
jgi:hypothetical protein